MASNPIQFWLSYNNGAERIQLPVNPASIKISSSNSYQDLSVNGLGEYTVIGDPVLKNYSFSSFFPRDYNPAYCEHTSLLSPWDYVATIERWLKTRRPIRLTVTGTPINTPVTIRNFEYEPERDGSVGDIYFSLDLKEYVFIYSFRREDKVRGDSSARPDMAPVPSSYTVVSGDSLWKIAQKFYGDGARWKAIYEANKAVVGANPNLIYPNQKLVIPA